MQRVHDVLSSMQVSREVWSARISVTVGIVRQEPQMSIITPPETSAYNYTSGLKATAHPSIAWLRGALVLAIGAQLITISALNSADPLSVSWAALLLAISPAPLCALTVLALRQYVKAACMVAIVVLLVGMIGGITRTGLFFLPELGVLAYATRKAWAE
jgi:hypothetical protein